MTVFSCSTTRAALPRSGAQWWAAKGWALPSQPVATPLVLVFVSGTMFWLLFPLICRDEGEDVLLEEWAVVVSFFIDVGGMLF
jgi:hypothetical protein